MYVAREVRWWRRCDVKARHGARATWGRTDRRGEEEEEEKEKVLVVVVVVVVVGGRDEMFRPAAESTARRVLRVQSDQGLRRAQSAARCDGWRWVARMAEHGTMRRRQTMQRGLRRSLKSVRERVEIII